jgi:Domain of unknown function (DUF5655)
MWTCPRCDRAFARAAQSHTCVPAGSIEDTLAGVRPDLREIALAALARVTDLGPVDVEPVRVGIFLRREDKLAEIRPKATFVQLIIMLPRRVTDRGGASSAFRYYNYVNLRTLADLDEQVDGWLAEAYAFAG